MGCWDTGPTGSYASHFRPRGAGLLHFLRVDLGAILGPSGLGLGAAALFAVWKLAGSTSRMVDALRSFLEHESSHRAAQREHYKRLEAVAERQAESLRILVERTSVGVPKAANTAADKTPVI